MRVREPLAIHPACCIERITFSRDRESGGASRLRMRKTAALHMGVLESARCWGDLMRVDLLAIAAHPDDVELTCGGAWITMPRRGLKSGIPALLVGGAGAPGAPRL